MQFSFTIFSLSALTLALNYKDQEGHDHQDNGVKQVNSTSVKANFPQSLTPIAVLAQVQLYFGKSPFRHRKQYAPIPIIQMIQSSKMTRVAMKAPFHDSVHAHRNTHTHGINELISLIIFCCERYSLFIYSLLLLLSNIWIYF